MRGMLCLGLALAVGLTACRERAEPPVADTTNAADSVAAPEDTLLVDDPSDLEEITDSVTFPREQSRAAGGLSGLAFGFSGWPRDNWCRNTFTGTFVAAPPNTVVNTVKRARECNFRVVLIWPRRMMTTNGQSDGAFSPEKMKQLADQYARLNAQVLPYVQSGHFIGYMPLDDMGCKRCWGGKGITQAQAEEGYKYAKQRLGAIPLGIRVIPAWIKQRPGMSQWIDFAWAQYVLNKGHYKTFFDKASADARSLPYPMKLAGGINVYHFSKPFDGRPITATELQTIGGYIIEHHAICFSTSWMAWDGWSANGRGAVVANLVAKAKQETNVPSCGR